MLGASMDTPTNPVIDVENLIRLMCIHSGKSGRQVSREMGRSENFISATIHQGSIPGIDLLSEIADACGFQIYAVGHDVRFNLNGSAWDSIDNFSDGVAFYNVSFDSDISDPLDT